VDHAVAATRGEDSETPREALSLRLDVHTRPSDPAALWPLENRVRTPVGNPETDGETQTPVEARRTRTKRLFWGAAWRGGRAGTIGVVYSV
jgi:hypothetical protein